MPEFVNQLQIDSLHTQRALLYWILTEGVTAWRQVRDFLDTDLFTDPVCLSVYAACSECEGAGEPINFQTIFARMPNQPLEKLLTWDDLQAWSGSETGCLITESIAVEMVNLLRRLAWRQGLSRLFRKMEAENDINEALEAARRHCLKFTKVRMRESSNGNPTTAILERCELVARGEKPVDERIYTKIPKLDRLTGGRKPGNLTVIAARTSHLKSGLAHQIALNVAQQKHGDERLRVGIFNYELTAEQTYERLLGILSGVGYSVITTDQVTAEDLPKLKAAERKLAELDLHVYRPSASLAVMEAEQAEKRFHVVVIDQVQDAALANGRLVERDGMRMAVTTMIHRYKNFANADPMCSIIVLSHVRKAMQGQPAGRLQIDDLKESGAIGERADVVLLGRWPRKYDTKADPNLYELRVAKNRQGGCCDLVKLYIELPSLRIRELEAHEAAMLRPPEPEKGTQTRADIDD